MPGDIANKTKNNVHLAPFTTIGLGGLARYFIRCQTIDDVKNALLYAKENNRRVHVLGGGSNTIFASKIFEGVILHIDLKGIKFKTKENITITTAKAGENWDQFVQKCIEEGLAGIECLSGIPGLVGATPVQNVGAYGQSVSDSIVEVQALDKQTLQIASFTNADCLFGYRSSRFKDRDANKYIILSVSYRLIRDGKPTIKYPELLAAVQSGSDKSNEKDLQTVRRTVLQLRKKKSMIIDKKDPHSQSCGSFFVSPLVTQKEFSEIQKKWAENHQEDIPHFPEGKDRIKIPAGWLIEKSGIKKGYRQGRVGVSPNHALALVNYGGDAKELLTLAEHVKKQVKENFGLTLQREPILVE